MIEISKINKHYTARVLKECGVEQILNDMKATPPGIGLSDKYLKIHITSHYEIN